MGHMTARQASLWVTSMPGRNLPVVGNKPRGSLSESLTKLLFISLFRDVPILVCLLSTWAYSVLLVRFVVKFNKSSIIVTCLHSMLKNVHVFARDVGNVTQAGSLPY